MIDIDSLYKYAILSRLAYHDVITINDIDREYACCISDEALFPFHFIQKENAQCWIFLHGEEAIVAFRGSDSWQDLLHSVLVNSTDFHSGKVHTGYLVHYNQIRDELLTCINMLIRDFHVKRITLTGHSIGGSCAMLCAMDVPKGAVQLGCVTFGSPSTGDNSFCEQLCKHVDNVASVVVHNDWVPKLFSHQHIQPLKIDDNKVHCYFNHNIAKYVSGIKALRPLKRVKIDCISARFKLNCYSC